MKSFARFTLAAALTAGLALAAGTAAPRPAPDAKASADDAQTGVSTVETIADAYKLLEVAESQKLPEAYLGAGRLFLRLAKAPKAKAGTSEFKAEAEDGKPVAAAATESKETLSFADEAETCFETGGALAKKQGSAAAVAALEAAIRKNPEAVGERGALGGPKVIQKAIGAGGTHTHTINFDTKTPGSIGFSASRPMRCKMQFGKFVHFDQVVRGGAYTWKPKPADGNVKTYVITVHNGGSAAGTYRIFTN